MRDGEFVLLFRRMIAEEWGKKMRVVSLASGTTVQNWEQDSEFVSLASGTTV